MVMTNDTLSLPAGRDLDGTVNLSVDYSDFRSRLSLFDNGNILSRVPRNIQIITLIPAEP